MKFSETYSGPPTASTVELRQFSLFSISLLSFSHFSFLSRLFLPSQLSFKTEHTINAKVYQSHGLGMKETRRLGEIHHKSTTKKLFKKITTVVYQYYSTKGVLCTLKRKTHLRHTSNIKIIKVRLTYQLLHLFSLLYLPQYILVFSTNKTYHNLLFYGLISSMPLSFL
jgi:hypothetical protein